MRMLSVILCFSLWCLGSSAYAAPSSITSSTPANAPITGGTAKSAPHLTGSNSPITAVTLSAGPTSPVIVGTPVSLSAVVTGGDVPEYEFYALYPLNGVNQQVLIQDYALSSTCTWTPTLAATYTLVVCVREQGSTVAYTAYDTNYGYLINPTPPPPITAVTLNAGPPSPVSCGTPVSLSAVATGGSVPEYKFYALYPLNGVNQQVLIQDYALSSTCTWTPAVAATYTLVVLTREHGSAVAYTAYNTIGNYLVNPTAPPPITAVTLTAGPSSPVSIGTQVSLSAVATGGSVPEYKFYALYPLNGVNQQVLIQDYALSSTCTWTPAVTATYTLVVCAREHGSTVAFTVYNTIGNYLVNPIAPPITAVTLNATPNSPVIAGTPISLSAVATGGSVPEYKFYALYPLNGVNQEVLIQDYALSSTCTWTPTVTATYTLVVCAREHGSTVAFTVYNTIGNYIVNPVPPPITAVTLNANPYSAVIIGTPVSLSAVATGGSVPEYKFYALYPLNGVNQEVLIQDYALSSTCTWTPAVAATYTLVVCVREHGSTVAYTVYNTIYGYCVNTIPPPITAVTLSVTPRSSVFLGTLVRLSAVATGGSVPEYKFYALYPLNGVNQEVLIQDYALSSTCTWTPSVTATYTLVVCAREHGSTVAYAAYNTTIYAVIPFTPPTITSFTPSSGGIGTVVTITGTNFSGTTVVDVAGFRGCSLHHQQFHFDHSNGGQRHHGDDHRHHTRWHGDQYRHFHLYPGAADHRGYAQRHPEFPGAARYTGKPERCRCRLQRPGI